MLKNLNSSAYLTIGVLAIASNLTLALPTSALNLKITVENLTPANGANVTPLWLGFHDGSFDTFNPSSPASSGIMYLAEEGLTGLEVNFPEAVEFFLNNGLDPAAVPPFEQTIAGLFANSSAGLNGGVQGLVIDPSLPLGIFPTQTLSTTITVDPIRNRFFSYGAMFFPSNDGFIADVDPLEIFDANGNFLGADFIIGRNGIWDSGTEVNTETPNHVPFSLAVFGEGIDENSTIQLHQGFLPPGSGGVLDFGGGFYANADFTNNPDFQFARITITTVPEPATATGLLTLGGALLLSRLCRRSS